MNANLENLPVPVWMMLLCSLLLSSLYSHLQTEPAADLRSATRPRPRYHVLPAAPHTVCSLLTVEALTSTCTMRSATPHHRDFPGQPNATHGSLCWEGCTEDTDASRLSSLLLSIIPLPFSLLVGCWFFLLILFFILQSQPSVCK